MHFPNTDLNCIALKLYSQMCEFFSVEKKKSLILSSSAFKAEPDIWIYIYTQMDFCPSSSRDFSLFICNCLDTFLPPFILIISDCDQYLETGALRLIQKQFLKEKFSYTVFCNTAVVTYCKLVVLDYRKRILPLNSALLKCLLYPYKKYLIKPCDQLHYINVSFPGLATWILRHRWVK